MRTEFRLRKRRVPVRRALHPLRLMRRAIQRQTLPRTLAKLLSIQLLFPFVLRPAPEPHCVHKMSIRNFLSKELVGSERRRTAGSLVCEEEPSDEPQEATEPQGAPKLHLRRVGHLYTHSHSPRQLPHYTTTPTINRHSPQRYKAAGNAPVAPAQTA